MGAARWRARPAHRLRAHRPNRSGRSVARPIPPALILPEVKDQERWLGGRHEYSDKEGALNLVFATTAKMLVAYDPRQVRPEEIDTLPKLLDPRWKGKIVIGDPIPPGASQV